MFSGRHLAGRGANLGIDSQDAEALARAVEAGEACKIGSYVQRLLEEGSSLPKICWDSSTQLQVLSLVRSPGDQSRPASAADACAIAINFQTLDVVFP